MFTTSRNEENQPLFAHKIGGTPPLPLQEKLRKTKERRRIPVPNQIMKIIQERKGNHEEKGGNVQCGKNEFSGSPLYP